MFRKFSGEKEGDLTRSLFIIFDPVEIDFCCKDLNPIL